MTPSLHACAHHGARYSQGAILPSYDVETRILDEAALDDMMLYAQISLVMVAFFAMLELIELIRQGPIDYVQNFWHLMDWGNYIIFLQVYFQVVQVRAAFENSDCL